MRGMQPLARLGHAPQKDCICLMGIWEPTAREASVVAEPMASAWRAAGWGAISGLELRADRRTTALLLGSSRWAC